MDITPYVNVYNPPMKKYAAHPFFEEADAIAKEYEVSYEIVHHAMIAAFMGVYQHWITVGDPLDPAKKIKIIQFLLTLAESGEKKSLITDLLLEPIRQHQQKLRDQNQQAPLHIKKLHALWKIKKGVFSSAVKRAYEDGCDNTSELEQRLQEHMEQEPKATPPTQLLLDGATVASLKKSLAASTVHPMVSTSEAIAFLKGLDEPFVAMLNRAWDGQPMVFETFRGDIDIPDPILSMSLLTQTSAFFKKIMGNTLIGDSGLWARFLMSVATPYFPIYDPHYQPGEGKAVIQRIHEKLRAQLEAPLTRHLTLSNTAGKKWTYVFNCIHQNRKMPGSKESYTPAFSAKMPEHILRLAAVIHLMYEEGDIIDIASIEVATSLVKKYHETQLNLFSSYYQQPQVYCDSWRLFDWLLVNRSGYMRTTEHLIAHNGPPSSRHLSSLREQLDILEERKMIYRIREQKSTYIYINEQFIRQTPQLAAKFRVG